MKQLQTQTSGIDGTGLFTTEPIDAHEHIAFITGAKVYKASVDAEDALSIPTCYGIGKDLWIDPGDSIWAYLNHSCEPNCAIVGTRKLIARQPIPAGTELTIDYSMTDGDLLWEMPCACSSTKCRKKIHSIQRIPENAFQAHLPFIPKYFIKLRKQHKASATL